MGKIVKFHECVKNIVKSHQFNVIFKSVNKNSRVFQTSQKSLWNYVDTQRISKSVNINSRGFF